MFNYSKNSEVGALEVQTSAPVVEASIITLEPFLPNRNAGLARPTPTWPQARTYGEEQLRTFKTGHRGDHRLLTWRRIFATK